MQICLSLQLQYIWCLSIILGLISTEKKTNGTDNFQKTGIAAQRIANIDNVIPGHSSCLFAQTFRAFINTETRAEVADLQQRGRTVRENFNWVVSDKITLCMKLSLVLLHKQRAIIL